jgi:hypothetical protein
MPGNESAARMQGDQPLVLLIQPPVYDYTAFDFYLYPLGLVEAGECLARHGFRPALLDALDRFAVPSKLPGLKPPTFRGDGCGHFHRMEIPPPPHLDGLPRRFHRFGLPRDWLRKRMIEVGKPAAAAITCSMTYWYPGVIEMKDLLREVWPDVPVILGGVYASLCSGHARTIEGLDGIFEGRELGSALQFLKERTGKEPALPAAPPSGHDLLGPRASAAVRSSSGCPRNCPYCAAGRLGGPFRRRPFGEVLDEIAHLVVKRNRERIAFYDDAFLDGEEAFLELAEGIRELELHERASFHLPNAVRASAVTQRVAGALKRTNFRTVRIGFETADPDWQKALGQKAGNRDLENAVDRLKRAGYGTEDIGVYLLAGLPGQEAESVEDSIRFVQRTGARCRLAEYAPVPGTPLFEEARRRSSLDLDEPLNHNKTLAPFRFSTLNIENLRMLKDLARGARS